MFIKECSNIYQSNKMEEKKFVSNLLKEINKRDEVHDFVVEKIGS